MIYGCYQWALMQSLTPFVNIFLCSSLPDLHLDSKRRRDESRSPNSELVQSLYLLRDSRDYCLDTGTSSAATALPASSLWQVTHLQILDDHQAAHLGSHHRCSVLIRRLFHHYHQGYPNRLRPV